MSILRQNTSFILIYQTCGIKRSITTDNIAHAIDTARIVKGAVYRLDTVDGDTDVTLVTRFN